ncbi:MAG: hypothetical protein EOO61_01360 [Hymenobacter sp.]|nr:MAG: hypothetical protein EOO61_01360 [Hymenobacter sp.]
MPEALLTYDIDGQHTAYKKRLKAMDYSDQISGTGTTNLPDTTMYHSNKTALQAKEDAKSLATSLKVKLERCLAVEISTWSGIVGDKHIEK